MGFKALSANAIGTLSASHRRQEERLGEAMVAATALAEGAGSRRDTRVIADVLAFLRKQAQRHIADEEESVFPRLSHRPGNRDLIAELLVEHREHDALLATLERLCEAWGEALPRIGNAVVFARKLAEFSDGYRAHIAREDAELLPAMEQLGADDLRAIASEMMARRPGGGKRLRGRGKRRRRLAL